MESQQQVKKLKLSDNSDSDSMEIDESPKLEKDWFLFDFLAQNYFYNNMSQAMKDHADIRNAKFGNQTVAQFFESVQSRNELKRKLSGTGVIPERVVPLWLEFRGEQPIEKILNLKIVPHGGVEEIKLLKKCYVNIPSYDGLRIENIHASKSRTEDIRFVLGSSGSGKTFFSLKIAAVERLDEPYVIVYIKLSMIDDGTNTIALDNEKLVDFVKKMLRDECKGRQMPDKLPLHLALILDEAGSTAFNNHFDSKTEMANLYKRLSKIALSARLVLCGTGVTGINFGSDGDTKKYRMKPWSMVDFEAVDDQHFKLGPTTLNTVQQHPQLKALITNARSAWYLLDAVKEFLNDFKEKWSEKWSDRVRDDRIKQQIVDFAPYIVGRVVSSYISSNGIKQLENIAQRRVAAYVFDALEQSRITTMFIPKFDELAFLEQNVAFSLISMNVETFGGGTKTLVSPHQRSISVTPAITIILYWMCGVSIEIVSDWKMQELLSALYEFRHQLRQLVQKYNTDRKKLDAEPSSEFDRKLALDELLSTFDDGLLFLRIIKLKKRVPEPRATKSFLIPNVDNRTIWMNQDLAPFADVVAPFTLYQCKYRKTVDSAINLMDELEKCGLLNGSQDNLKNEIGWIITKSLEYTWISKIDRNGSIEDDSPSDSTDATKSRFFYPDAQLTGKAPDPIEDYFTVEKVADDWKCKGKVINTAEELSKELYFVISCNQCGICLSRNEIVKDKPNITYTMKVKSEYLDNDGNIKEDILPDEYQKEWEQYKTILRENVKLRFLLS